MEFLFPAFLFALPVVVIPVIIHLFNFRRYVKADFSNVAFLREIRQQASAPRNLKRLWLLIVRMLAVIFLILAFARPYLPADRNVQGSTRPRLISVYIDNSYSMEVRNREGSLLDEAKRRAKEIAAAYGLNDKFQLLTNDFEGKYQRFLNYEDFLQAVDGVKTSRIRRSIKEVLERQEDLMTDFQNLSKHCYLLSDFQRNLLLPGKIKKDREIMLRMVKLNTSPQSNISIDSAWFISPVYRPGAIEKLVVRLRNNSDKNAESVPVRISIDRHQEAVGSINVQAGQPGNDTVSFAGLSSGWKQGEVSISDYPVTFDDRYFFSFYVRDSVPLLIVNAEAENRYLQALYAAEPFFKVKAVNAGNINYAETGAYPMIILNGTVNMTPGLAGQLKTYVKNGGSLIVFPSLSDGLAGIRIFSSNFGTDVPQSIINIETRVNRINIRHPLFSGVFNKQAEQNIDLPVASNFIQYSRSSLPGTAIMELPGKHLFLEEYRVGEGHAYLSAVPLDESASNLVTHSLFVPLMYQMAFSGLHDPPLAFTIGKDTYLPINTVGQGRDQVLQLKGDKAEIIPDLVQTESGVRLFIADQIRDEGHYQVLRNGRLLSLVAFNDSREESDLHYASGNQLLQQFSGNGVNVLDPKKKPLGDVIKAVNNGVELWKLCIILALVFLAAEIVLLRFYGRTKAGNIELIK